MVNTITGYLRYFDKLTGNGLIVSDCMQKSWYFKFDGLETITDFSRGCNFGDQSKAKQREVTSIFKTGTRVAFEMYEDSHFKTPTNIRAV